MMQYLEITVTPSSKKQRITLSPQGILKCYLVSVPEKGKANKELVDLLALHLEIPKHAIVIVKGETSRKKTVHITTDYSKEEILKKLIPHYQSSFLHE